MAWRFFLLAPSVFELAGARNLSIVCAGAAELARSLAQRPGMADSVIIREREVFATPMLREKALVQFVSQPRAMK